MAGTIIRKITLKTVSAFLWELLWFKRSSQLNGQGFDRCFDGHDRDPRIPEAKREVFCLIVRPQVFWLPFLFFIAAVAVASPQAGDTVPTVETIVARMALAQADNQMHIRSYIVTRNYELFGKERKHRKSQVIADVTFVPPGLKHFSIQQTSGAGLGEKIVRRMLASETEIAKDYSLTNFTAENYDFLFSREEDASDQACYVLQLLPRRHETNLIRGNIWVDASTFLVRRAEGVPEKSPSWWVRDIHIALFYSDVGGMWLQTASEGTAMVRIFGPFTIVSRNVKYRTNDAVVNAHWAQIGN
jgi:hypothetical protein